MTPMIALFIFLTVYSVIFYFFPWAPDPARRLAARLQGHEKPAVLRVERRDQLSSLPLFDRLLKKISPLKHLRTWLHQSAIGIPASVFLLMTAVLGSGLFFLLNFLHLPGSGAWIISAAAAAVPSGIIQWKRCQRTQQFSCAFPDAVSRMASSLRAGYSLQMAIEALTEDLTNLVAVEFKKVLSELEVGQSFEAALQGMLERIDAPDLRLFIASVIIQRESGGNLAELLDNLEAAIQERFALRRELSAATSQARFSGIVLSLLPVFVGAIVYFIHRDYILFFFQDPVGQMFFKGCLGGQALGMWSMYKIVSIQI